MQVQAWTCYRSVEINLGIVHLLYDHLMMRNISYIQLYCRYCYPDDIYFLHYCINSIDNAEEGMESRNKRGVKIFKAVTVVWKLKLNCRMLV